MPIPEKPTFVIQESGAPIGRFVLHLLVETNETAEAIGTAVWLCSHLVLTARHNLEYILNRYGAPIDGAIIDYAIRLYQVIPGPEYIVWEVRSVATSAESDLAVMHLCLFGYTGKDPPTPYIGLHLKALPPEPGCRVALIGFRKQTAVYSRNSDGSLHLDLNSIPQAASGTVIEVHAVARDAAQYPFPCYRINARIDGGMSGGPVFDEFGRLAGICCGSLPGYENDEPASYITTLWPLLRTIVTFNPRGGDDPLSPYPLISLAKSGVLPVADLLDLPNEWFRELRSND